MSSEFGLAIKKPIAAWNKPLKANFRDIFAALGNAGFNAATGQWTGLGENAIDLLSAVGLEDQGPAELAWVLIYRSLTQAIGKLMADSEFLIQYVEQNLDELADTLDLSLENGELEISDSFFRCPDQLPLLEDIQIPLAQWFQGFGLTEIQAMTLARRLPSYFVFALNSEWKTRPQDYSYLNEQIKTPFTQAAEEQRGWNLYNAWLCQQVEEPMMLEAFGLQDVYVKPRAYFRQLDRNDNDDFRRQNRQQRFKRVVVDLETELRQWLCRADKDDAIRVISGDPGSGKSSFAKIFAASHSRQTDPQLDFQVMFVPLHHLDFEGDLLAAVAEFASYDEYIVSDPIDKDDHNQRRFLIFDGLDELAMQGKLSREAAQKFVKDVRDEVNRFNGVAELGDDSEGDWDLPKLEIVNQ